MRRLRRPHQRRSDQILHDPRRAVRGRQRADDRRRRQRRPAAPDAGSLPQQSRAAMRLLHARHGVERARPSEEQPEADRQGNPRIPRRQSLPLHRLSQHRAGDRRRRGSDARRHAGAQPPWGGRGVTAMAEGSIGTPVRRREDYRFLTGQGTYTDDINRPGQLYAYILRSPHANARLNRIDTSGATSAPGVVAVFSGQDMAKDGIGGLPCGWLINSKDGSPMKEPPHPVLAVDRVRHVGDPVAVVIADSLGQARDAAENIAVDYAVEPAVVDVVAALKPGAPQVWPEAPGNICYDWHLGDAAAVETAIGKAARVVKLDLINNRLIANAMEPRAAIGEFDRATGEHTLYTTSQNPHVIRLLMGANVLHIPESKLRVVAPDVGGGFGSKVFHYAEEAIVTWAANKVRKPVKWTADRSESFMSDAHGRDHVTHAELALDVDGKFLALQVSTIANLGAYLSTFSTAVPTYLYGTLLAGTYTTPAIYVETKAVFTNTVPVDAYRCAGRPEATFVVERIVDLAADELGMDPAELRRRNFIPKDAFPYQTPVALQYDSGDYQTTLELALEAAGYP